MRESWDRLKDTLLSEALPAFVGTFLILTFMLGVVEVVLWLVGA